MPINILMPALSPTMTEGTLAKWLVKEGDEIGSGDVIAEIETDKATMEVEAVDEGIIAKIMVEEGTEGVAVNDVIAILAEEGEDPAEVAKAGPSEGGPAPAPQPKEAEAKEEAPSEPAAKPAPEAAPKQPAAAPQTATKSGGRIFASPLARRIAQNEGVDLADIKGTGPHGRIIRADVDEFVAGGGKKAKQEEKAAPEKAIPAKPPAAVSAPVTGLTLEDPIFKLLPEYEAIPNSNMRKTIARRLTDSARDIPHFNVQADVEIDALLALRKQLNEREGADYKISVNDFVVKATALALTRVPECNVAYTAEATVRFKRVDMAIAVAIDGGLITPIIKDCASKGLATISRESKELAGKAREGKLKPEEYQGGTFSISNLGMFNVKSFNSIINEPQAGILSVGAGEQRPVVKDGALAIATVMTLSLAVDHRAVDGATAAMLLKELKSILEDPIALML